ncbi:MAG: hypothetical protein R2729_27825 [Bryobacteraceae bacterium]
MRPLLAGAVLAIVCTVPAAAKGKKYRHPLGFQIELPEKWVAEPSPAGATLHPPGAKVNPDREDNAEVYWFWAPSAEKSSENDYVRDLRENLKASNVEVERGGDLEGFSSPGRPGVIYTFDFTNPADKKDYRIRVFAMQRNGKTLLLIAKGRRDRVEARDKLLREMAMTLEWKN